MNKKMIPINNKCPICNNPLINISNDDVLGVKCTNCDYGYVTDNIHEWQEDGTIYKIYFKSNNSLPFDKLKYIAKRCQTSCIKVKNDLAKNNLFFEKGLACELKDDIIDMNEKGIEYEIIPNFKYTFK